MLIRAERTDRDSQLVQPLPTRGREVSTMRVARPGSVGMRRVAPSRRTAAVVNLWPAASCISRAKRRRSSMTANSRSRPCALVSSSSSCWLSARAWREWRKAEAKTTKARKPYHNPIKSETSSDPLKETGRRARPRLPRGPRSSSLRPKAACR